MKASQRGVTLSGLLAGAFVVAILALLGMKVFPEYMEKRIPLFANVSLILDFTGSSKD